MFYYLVTDTSEKTEGCTGTKNNFRNATFSCHWLLVNGHWECTH